MRGKACWIHRGLDLGCSDATADGLTLIAPRVFRALVVVAGDDFLIQCSAFFCTLLKYECCMHP